MRINKKNIVMTAVGFLLFMASCVARCPSGDERFPMSDATYHVLLTMQAYDETSAAVHHWLPIQSYAGEENKYINNGPSLIQDAEGNQYYVSFSSFGFWLPYAFCKLFRLKLVFRSIYYFNCVLYLLSAILMGRAIFLVFKKEEYAYASFLCYLFLPEILFTQGIVYWHHSLSQVILLLQYCLFVELFMMKKRSRYKMAAFLCACFLYPYAEWTGFISNVGILLGIILSDIRSEIGEEGRRRISLEGRNLLCCLGVLAASVGAVGMYLWDYSHIVAWDDFFEVMTSRAGVRSGASVQLLAAGHIRSFFPLLAMIVFLVIFSMFRKNPRNRLIRAFRSKKGWVLLGTAGFPVLENLVMRQHAASYSFDRLKMALPLMLVLFFLFSSMEQEKKRLAQVGLAFGIGIVVLCGGLSYRHQGITKLAGMEDTLAMKECIEANYLSDDKGLLVKDGWRAWGFLQTLYHRNIYCTDLYSEDELSEIARREGKDYIVFLECTEPGEDASSYAKARVRKVEDGKDWQLAAKDGKVEIIMENDKKAHQ